MQTYAWIIKQMVSPFLHTHWTEFVNATSTHNWVGTPQLYFLKECVFSNYLCLIQSTRKDEMNPWNLKKEDTPLLLRWELSSEGWNAICNTFWQAVNQDIVPWCLVWFLFLQDISAYFGEDILLILMDSPLFFLCKLGKWCPLDWVLWARHSRRQVNSCILHCMCICRTKPLFFHSCVFLISSLSVKGKWWTSQEGIG